MIDSHETQPWRHRRAGLHRVRAAPAEPAALARVDDAGRLADLVLRGDRQGRAGVGDGGEEELGIGMFRFDRTSSVGPCSTTCPAYITTRRSAT